jgi:hypothetical protein
MIFSVIGVIVAVESGASPLWLWGPLLAMLTGAGGGIMRDVIRADSNMPSLKGEFYAEVALIWGFLFSLFLSRIRYNIGLGPRLQRTTSADDVKGGCHAVDNCRDSSGAVGARLGQFVHGRRVGPSIAGDRRRCHRGPVH